MDWLVDRVFPFRRLTVWLGLLLLVVIVLALALTAVLVLPSLDDSLVSNRVDTVARSAGQSAATFQTNFENALQGAMPVDALSRAQLLSFVVPIR